MNEQLKKDIDKVLVNMLDEMTRQPHTIRRVAADAANIITMLDHFEPKTCKCGSAPKAKKKSPTPTDAD